MTDRAYALTVTLDGNYRTDDLEDLITAIKQLRGVADVAYNVADPLFYATQQRARADLSEKLWNVLKEDLTRP